MKTVILDKCTIVTDNDISFDPIYDVSDVEEYDLLTEDEIIDAAQDADAIICNKAEITEQIFDSCKKLKFVGLFATGYNNIDLDAADKHHVFVANVPGYSTESVAQHTFGMILALASSICQYDSSVKSGEWCRSAAFSYLTYPITEIYGKTLGIFGFGTIGKAVARIGEAFGMNVIVHTRTKPSDCKFAFVSKEELFAKSDFLTFHCPLNSDTYGIVNKITLSLMKPTAYLINTSRGGIVIENDLRDALNSGVIAGAGIDVVSAEPMKEDNPLRTAKNTIITPHVAWASSEARIRLISKVAENLSAFKNGRPINIVNSPKGV